MSNGKNAARVPLVCLMGPTASGKTGLAVQLVEQFPLDIISVDSALVYRGMNIGTAKPDRQTLQAAPHRLIDICNPEEAYSAARFCSDANKEISEIRKAGRIPLLVGGTMLYFRALLEGLSRLPAADPAIRARLEKEAAQKGWPAMHEELRALDPVAAGRINRNDPQRIQRALEVIRISGRKMSDLQSESGNNRPDFEVLKLVICPHDRQLLHQRIKQRFEAMIKAGFVAEVEDLHQRPELNNKLPSMRAVGYRQCWEWLEGHLDDDEWQEKVIVATRQLAKRQLTWLRREKQALWYDSSMEGSNEKVFAAVRDFLALHH